MLQLPLTLASPAGRRGKLTVLSFHRVRPGPDPLVPDLPDAAQFEQQMRWVRDWFNVVPLAEGIERLYAGDICSRALAITFDDGYADNEELAAPILHRLGLSATFFVSTGFLDGDCMWNDRIVESLRAFRGDELDLGRIGLRRYACATPQQRSASLRRLLLDVKHFDAARRDEATHAIAEAAGTPLPRGLMMTPAQVAHLQALGMDVGGHTVSHPILARIDASAARREIGQGKERLEQILGRRLALFAYPNGIPGRDYAPEHVGLVRDCGFSAAVSTLQGAATRDSDRFQVPRFAPWARSRSGYGARLLANLMRRRALPPPPPRD